MRGRGSVTAAWALGLVAALCATALLAADPEPARADGPAGSIRLPVGIEAEPPALQTTGSGPRSSQVLRHTRNGKTAQASLLQSCASAPPDLRSEKNLEILMQGLAVMQRQTLGKVNGWVTLGERRAYRMDSVRDGGGAATMWMAPMGEKMAVLRYERPADFALDDEMIAAIERMELRCGSPP
ncbi:hypothetical protein [Lysobacter sp. Root604]|uniref:hypothetical protein n=1 Tax=Lysobacter sp. Root604 TaxID=1736568 RepID=UPI0006F60FCD|nr:hypothetical protein [Lysobacter sp. Root604]KRA14937.1 hypothetical protein ASD69_18875 [Lysobacter sp. Root604]